MSATNYDRRFCLSFVEQPVARLVPLSPHVRSFSLEVLRRHKNMPVKVVDACDENLLTSLLLKSDMRE
jgi:hypothetical protein